MSDNWSHAVPLYRHPEPTIHLYENQGYDESQVWCGDDDYYRHGATAYPEQAACPACLRSAAEFGDKARARLASIMPARTNDCPYDAHADDCDCGGVAGDR